jgi:DNA-binding transcriptional MocR family regulator
VPVKLEKDCAWTVLGGKTVRAVATRPTGRPTKYEQLASEIVRLIEGGTYRPGDRLPSVRQLRRQRRLSITTALQAYYWLENQGWVEARPQSGYYVRSHLPTALPEPEISAPTLDPAQVSLHALVMMVLQDSQKPRLAQLGAAIPNPDLLPSVKLGRILGSLARRADPATNQYDIPPGCEALRIQVARRAAGSGVNLTPADIVTTSGCMEAMELSLRATCRPGDTVAIESPTYFGILQSLEALGLRALEIPTHPRDGISLEALRFAIDHTSIRVCLITPNFNNPLGSLMPEDRKKQLVDLLSRKDIPLIENDVSGEIYFTEHRPGVAKAHDRKGMVLLCSSFSKDLAPGYRVGWVAPGRFRDTVEWLKYTTNIGAAMLPQLAIAEFLASAGYDHHLRRIRRVYARHVAQMAQAVMRSFPEGTRVTRPQGGFVLWVQMPEQVDSLMLYRAALRSGITITPGHIFSATQRYRNFIRLNAAFWSPREERAVERLGELIEAGAH